MRKINLIFVSLAMIAGFNLNAQIAVSTDGSNADPSAMFDVKSPDKGVLPPRMDEARRNAIANPAAGLMIYNTSTNKPNYYNGTEWMNFDGTSASTVFVIGLSYGGGKIAYILQSGDPGYTEGETHGLIATESYQVFGAGWGCYGTGINGADGTSIGTGGQNTLDILAGCSETGIAAQICATLVLNGYDDWYLPSKDELYKLYLNRAAIGNFSGDYYWSSSECSNWDVWELGFDIGEEAINTKEAPDDIARPVRSF